MAEVLSSRKEPVACRNQLGRCTGSTAQDTRLSKVSETRAGHYIFTPKHMTDVYAQNPLDRIPITILGRPMDALRVYVRAVEAVGDLPAYDGWDDIAKLAPRVGDMGVSDRHMTGRSPRPSDAVVHVQ